MSGTLIERNTVELQEILNEVKNLPSASATNSKTIYNIAMGLPVSITAEELEGATRITSWAFYLLSGGMEVSIPNSVKVIESEAFAYSLIVALDLGNGVERINDGAFYGCITGGFDPMNVNIPSSVKRIEDEAFLEASDAVFTFKGKPEYISPSTFDAAINIVINVPWSEGEVANEPWGADATINYNYTGE